MKNDSNARKYEEFDLELFEDICDRLWEIGNTLNGLGALFKQQMVDPVYEGDEISGVGQLIQNIACEIFTIEGLLDSLKAD